MQYDIQDNETGRKLRIDWEGENPPSESDITEIFQQQIKPERSAGEFLGEKLPLSAGRTIAGLAGSLGESVKAVGMLPKMPIDIAQQVSTGQQPIPKGIEELAGGAEATRQEYGERYGGLENIKRTAYEKPVEMALDIASIVSPIKAKLKSTGTIKPKMMQEVSELLGGKMQASTVKNVAQNPYVRKNISIYAPEDMNTVVKNASDATMRAKEGISQAENYVYQKHGITDDMVMPGQAVNESLANIKSQIDNFSKGAIGENKKLAAMAQSLYSDIVSQTKAIKKTPQKKTIMETIDEPYDVEVPVDPNYTKEFGLPGAVKTETKFRKIQKPREVIEYVDEPINKPITFGQLKSLTRQIYDLSDSNVTPEGKFTEAGVLYRKIGKELTKAKKSVLPIKEASEQFSSLMEAEGKLRDTLRLDRVNGEQTLPMKILRRRKDAEHGQFKQELESVNDIFKKHKDILKENPETADLINEYGNADFIDKIKLTQALEDMIKTKEGMISPVGMGRSPLIGGLMKGAKVFDPISQMVTLKRLVDKGIVNPARVSEQIPVSGSIIGGRTMAKGKAISHLLGIPKSKFSGKEAITINALIAGGQQQ